MACAAPGGPRRLGPARGLRLNERGPRLCAPARTRLDTPGQGQVKHNRRSGPPPAPDCLRVRLVERHGGILFGSGRGLDRCVQMANRRPQTAPGMVTARTVTKKFSSS